MNAYGYIVTMQILARSFYNSSVHELRMMEISRDGRTKAKHRRKAVYYQNKASECYARYQSYIYNEMHYKIA